MRLITKLILLAIFFVATFSATCDAAAQIRCQSDINHAYPACKKAAEEKGKDAPADL
jgi:hypothetical protein